MTREPEEINFLFRASLLCGLGDAAGGDNCVFQMPAPAVGTYLRKYGPYIAEKKNQFCAAVLISLAADSG